MKPLKELKTRRMLPVVNKRQKDIAKEIGVSLSQFKRYENQESPLPLRIAVKWAKTLDLDFETFMELWKKDYKEE